MAFSSLGVFPTTENVLFLAGVVSPDLLALHRGWHDLAAAFDLACRPHYRPGRWVPHCTLTMLLTTPDLLRGVAELAAGWTPLEGWRCSVAPIQALPVVTLFARDLAGAP